jgi:acetyltransferase-like isoleucine patch superfamily enzyme
VALREHGERHAGAGSVGTIGRFRGNLVKARQVLHARIALRRCTEVGPLTRLTGGVIVSNAGSLRLGARVKLNGAPVPIELVALQGAELSIGEGTSINRGVSICAQKSVRIGNNCGIGNDCLIFDTDFHTLGDPSWGASGASPVSIGDNVWLAARSVILKGVTIGDGAVVCAGSVVAINVAPYTMVGGVPARLIRKLRAAGDVSDQTSESAPIVAEAVPLARGRS